MTDELKPSRDIAVLLEVMKRLREGCPWDKVQTFETIAPYTIEEAYEVADAIARKDVTALREELGDLLLQVVFHARIAEEAGLFNFTDVVKDGKPTAMAAFGKQLNDVEIASVITFTRNNWGNKTGEVIQPSEVKAARK